MPIRDEFRSMLYKINNIIFDKLDAIQNEVQNNEKRFIQRREIQIKLKFNLYGCHLGGKHSLFSF